MEECSYVLDYLGIRICSFEAGELAINGLIVYNMAVFIGLLKDAISKLPIPEIVVFRLVTMLTYTSFSLATLPYLVSIAVFFYLLQNSKNEDFLRDA